jgi:hypothetical protein
MQLGIVNGRLLMDIQSEMHGSNLEEDDVGPLLRPLLKRSGAAFIAAVFEGVGNQAWLNVRIELARRGATVCDAVTLADNVRALLRSVIDRDLTADSAFELITAGRADLLVGLPESPWLEAKSRGYDLADEGARIEFAQDVARFANGDTPGLLVVGLATRKVRGVDTISSVRPALTSFDAARHYRTLDNKIFPPLQDLQVLNIPVETIDGRRGYLLAVLIPRQPEEAKPILVHGAIVAGKVEGAFISIVRRRGEHSIPVRPESIHAALAAGRALLRRGSAESI